MSHNIDDFKFCMMKLTLSKQIVAKGQVNYYLQQRNQILVSKIKNILK